MTAASHSAGVDLPGHCPDRTSSWWGQMRAFVLEQSAALPLPGGGLTSDRWTALRGAGRGDLVAGKILESHTDAVAILAEAGRRVDHGVVYGVWASGSGGTGLLGTRSSMGKGG